MSAKRTARFAPVDSKESESLNKMITKDRRKGGIISEVVFDYESLCWEVEFFGKMPDRYGKFTTAE